MSSEAFASEFHALFKEVKKMNIHNQRRLEIASKNLLKTLHSISKSECARSKIAQKAFRVNGSSK